MSVFGIIVKIGRLRQNLPIFGGRFRRSAVSRSDDRQRAPVKQNLSPSTLSPSWVRYRSSPVFPAILLLVTTTMTVSIASAQLALSPGDLLVRKAAKQLRQHPSVTAKIRQQINLFGQRLPGSGVYLQQRTRNVHRMRMELKIQRSSQITSIQQVSDGRFLWLYRNVEGKPELSRIDLKRIKEASGGNSPPLASGLLLPEGLPAVVEQLAQNFRFDQPRPAMLRGEKIWGLVGNWRAEKIKEWPEHQVGTTEADGTIRIDERSPHLPERVEIALGRDDLFPYRIQYLRRNSSESTDDSSFTPMVTMLIFDVRIGEPLDPMLFAYHPHDLEVQDETSKYIERLAKRWPDDN